jgi:hypothetical protein
VSDPKDEVTPGGEPLLMEVEVTKLALETFYRQWVDHYYGAEEQAPEDPQPFQDARRIVFASDEEFVAEGISPKTSERAYTFLHALDKHRDAVETFMAEAAYSHPEYLGELNRRLEEIQGGEGSPDN